MGNHQWGGADPRNARSVGTKGAPSLIFFVLSDITSDGDYRPLLHLRLPWFWHHRSPQFRGWEEGTSKTTPDRGTSPPPPLFPAISAPGGGMTLAPSILTQRGELHLPVASKRGQMTQWGGLHPLVVSSFLFSTQRGSVDLPLCCLSFFDATGRCPPAQCVVFPFSDVTGKSAPSLRPSTLFPNTKRHPHWYLFVFGVIPLPYNPCWAWKDTFVGVFSCSASSLHLMMHAEHKKTPLRVSFRVRCLLFALLLMPSTQPHHRGCSFVFGVFPSPYNACWAGNYTIEGVVSCSVPSPCPTMHAEHSACLLAIIETVLVFGVSFFFTIPTVLGRWIKHISVWDFASNSSCWKPKMGDTKEHYTLAL